MSNRVKDVEDIGIHPMGVDVKTTGDAAQASTENQKDDCSDLTDNNAHDGEEQAPKTFPQKLLEILSDEEQAHIISWLPHGNGFAIHRKKTFAAEILPKYFKASKFTSFTRKLNRWGFIRMSRGPETGAYYHKLFVKSKPDLVAQMSSNSGNKLYQHGGIGTIMPSMPPMYLPPPPHLMANMTPQQQQAIWQQQMQQMMHFQMMQMQSMQATMPDGLGMSNNNNSSRVKAEVDGQQS